MDVIAPPRGYYLSLREGPMAGATIRFRPESPALALGIVPIDISKIGLQRS